MVGFIYTKTGMVVVHRMFGDIVLYLIVSLVLALPVGNAICYIAFPDQDLPDEHGESMLNALFESVSLVLLGDKFIVYRVYL